MLQYIPWRSRTKAPPHGLSESCGQTPPSFFLCLLTHRICVCHCWLLSSINLDFVSLVYFQIIQYIPWRSHTKSQWLIRELWPNVTIFLFLRLLTHRLCVRLCPPSTWILYHWFTFKWYNTYLGDHTPSPRGLSESCGQTSPSFFLRLYPHRLCGHRCWLLSSIDLDFV